MGLLEVLFSIEERISLKRYLRANTRASNFFRSVLSKTVKNPKKFQRIINNMTLFVYCITSNGSKYNENTEPTQGYVRRRKSD